MILRKTPLNTRECKFIRYCINQNTTLINLLLKPLPTNSNSPSALRFARGIKSARQKCGRQKRHRLEKRHRQKRDKITIHIAMIYGETKGKNVLPQNKSSLGASAAARGHSSGHSFRTMKNPTMKNNSGFFLDVALS